MSEAEIFFDSGQLKIEGLVDNLPGEKGVVVTHPHPLYGGEMYNNVVEAIVQAYQEQGHSTLRFNFRGVGRSEGSYDNGQGEQDDVRAALNHLSVLGKSGADLVGYSFGAWVNALGIEKFDDAARMVMVSPPVNFISFDFLKYNPKIQLVIAGNRDEIAGYKAIERLLKTWNPEATLRIIADADHFYWGRSEELKAIIREFLDEK
jgi:alpha/beta superfamily hydrolase